MGRRRWERGDANGRRVEGVMGGLKGMEWSMGDGSRAYYFLLYIDSVRKNGYS
jgi:hypothetical protein